MAEPLTITLKTLTPLWTGGVDGKSDRLHATGIMGSLRWWYEAIVRGMGGRVCDPTDNGCIYERKPGEGHEQAYARLCEACRMFGCTGWRRRFQIEAQIDGKLVWQADRTLNFRPGNRNRGWYLPPGQVGRVVLHLIGEADALAQVTALLRFLEQWGAIGARPQLGYGVFQIEGIKGEAKEWTWRTLSGEPLKIGDLPDLRTFTFFRLHFKPQDDAWWTQVDGVKQLSARRPDGDILRDLAAQGMVPVSPALKNHLRYGLKWSSAPLTQWLFGVVRSNDRQRGKLGLSWAYRQEDAWEIRGWVHLPQDASGRHHYADIVRNLGAALQEPHAWFKALSVAGHRFPAHVTCAPDGSAWRIHDVQQCATFLNDVARRTVA